LRLDSGPPHGHADLVPLTPENLHKVLTELGAVSRSAKSKREEAANLARIWGRVEDVPVGRHRSMVAPPVPAGTAEPAAQSPGDEFRASSTTGRARRRSRWRRVA